MPFSFVFHFFRRIINIGTTYSLYHSKPNLNINRLSIKKKKKKMRGISTLECWLSQTSQLTRFGSRFWNPGCTVVDAFSISWQTELSWLCPPIHLIGRCIRKLQRDKADGSLLVPLWFSAPWWPMLIGHDKEFKSLVTDVKLIERRENLFLSGSCTWNLFSEACPSCDILLLRICCCGHHQRRLPLKAPTPQWG